MGNRRLGRKRLESMLKKLNATTPDSTGSRTGQKGFDMPAFEIQPSKYFGYFDDFMLPNGAVGVDADEDLAQETAIDNLAWRTNVDGTSDTITLDNSYSGGVVKILGGTGDNEETHMTAINSGFSLDASNSRKCWLEARIAVGDADKTGWFVGIASDNGAEETSILTDGGGATEDAIGFYVIAGDAATDINLITAVGDDETLTDTGVDVADGTITAGTGTGDNWLTLSWYYDGSQAHAYVNGELKASTGLTLPTTAGTVMFPAIHLAARVGSAADTLHIDYIIVCQER